MKCTTLKDEARKRELIEWLSKAGKELAVYCDEPPGGALKFTRVREGLVVVSPPYEYDTLAQWWYMGNWQAVTPPAVDFEPLITFRATNDQIQQHAARHGVSLIIDSFHDNAEWNVIEAQLGHQH